MAPRNTMLERTERRTSLKSDMDSPAGSNPPINLIDQHQRVVHYDTCQGYHPEHAKQRYFKAHYPVSTTAPTRPKGIATIMMIG